jgi:endonuclease YncB( thermonuclease family)
MKTKSWQGKAEVLEVHDGDTFKVFVDLGFSIYARIPVRVHGINAPELLTTGGIAAKVYLQQLLQPGALVTLNSRRIDLHGRAEADVQLGDGRDLAALMLASGHAVPADDRGNLP